MQRALLLTLSALACGGCCLFRQAVQPTPQPPSLLPCLSVPPPGIREDIQVAGPEDGCPPAFTACITQANAVKLNRYIDSLDSYGAEAWLRCGVKP